jgi:formylglycine-generating enzyme required for sulfatase activity
LNKIDQGQSIQEFLKLTLDESADRAERRFAPGTRTRMDLGNGVSMMLMAIPPHCLTSDDGIAGDQSASTTSPPPAANQGFLIGRVEVTQQQFEAVMGENPSQFRGDPSRPVDSVSWHDAIAFCAALTKQQRDNGSIVAPVRFTLPSEAQWEHACQAGSSENTASIDDKERLGLYAWYHSNAGGETHPSGQKAPNAWGVFDMHGNVWEWCLDAWRGGHRPAFARMAGQVDAEGAQRIVRGGGYSSFPLQCGSSFQGWDAADGRYDFNGFRVILTPN